MGKFIDLTGKKFTKLTVIEYKGCNNGRSIWLCKCDCGKEIIITSKVLLNGNTNSCGCYAIERAKEANTKHGLYKHKLYDVWSGIKSRCYEKKHKYFNYYGGRGISVCEEWRNDFKVFYDWAVNNGYKDGLTIDRIDSNGNYEPSNCRWTTWKIQGNNTRKNVFIEYRGEIKTLSEWCEKLDLAYYTIQSRIKKLGWSVEKAFEMPIRKLQRIH